MKHVLPERTLQDFRTLCSRWLTTPEVEPVAERLLAHYLLLRQWAKTHDLIGPGTYDGALVRHYEEALCVVGQLPAKGVLVDLGSGAGFPGFVLACVRPALEVVLVEPRIKRASFLRAAARAAGLEVTVHAARLPLPLPEVVAGPVDVVTVRALKVEAATAAALIERFPPTGRWLAWCGEESNLPGGLRLNARLPLPGLQMAHVAIGSPL